MKSDSSHCVRPARRQKDPGTSVISGGALFGPTQNIFTSKKLNPSACRATFVQPFGGQDADLLPCEDFDDFRLHILLACSCRGGTHAQRNDTANEDGRSVATWKDVFLTHSVGGLIRACRDRHRIGHSLLQTAQ